MNETQPASLSTASRWPTIASAAQWINLLLPGGGLICVGDIAGGLALGLLFTVCASLAVTASLIVPDDFTLASRNLTIIAAALVYVLSQFVFAQSLRSATRRQAAEQRRACLAQVTEHLAGGQPSAAAAALAPLRSHIEGDLL